ncbi:hypothetical protein UM89_21100 [Bacillus subtilis]|nr:hypothetical protein UM89_21100 [Bacillus subtilis]
MPSYGIIKNFFLMTSRQMIGEGRNTKGFETLGIFVCLFADFFSFTYRFIIILISKPAPTVAPYLEKRTNINH